MAKKPNLKELEKRMEKGDPSFTITGEEYLAKTGADFPKNKSYATNKSAIAALAKAHGYRLKVKPLEITFEKVEGE